MISNAPAPRKIYVLLLLAALTNLITIGAMALTSRTMSAGNTAEATAYLKVTVVDGATGIVLQGANVCIPEINGYYSTDSNGVTATIPIPYRPNTNFDKTLKRAWGDITVLTYKDGYADFIIFYIMTTKDTTRRLTITLYPSSTPMTHTLIESPDPNWVQDFVNKYKK